ncbi:MAG TPA: topoisomerase C-terminal repeat-containing protein, partial [Verrucomicrobiae bacterium]|nr:topoisomerase C-terminal repeat-containing protein [Verrucomicrobiae bacterium]
LPTEKGIGVIQVLPVTEIKSPDLTGEWEYKLQLVERGQLQAEKFLQEITEFTQNTAAVLKDTAKQKISTPAMGNKGEPGDRPKRKRAQMSGEGEERTRVNGTDGNSDSGTTTAAQSQNGMEENSHTTISARLESLGKCPKCGLPVTRNKKGFGCTGWKEGCKFQIWSPVAGKNLTDVQGKQLLAKGATAKLQGFKSKAGKPFAAVLELIPEGDGKLNFRF